MKKLVMPKRQFKKLTALLWAQLDLKEAAALCALATSGQEEQRSEDTIFGLWTGVVVAYARSFTQNKGVSALDPKFRRFTSKRDQSLHDRLIEMRHRLHAHKDRLWEEMVATTFFPKANAVARIIVRVSEDGQTEWQVQRPVFPHAYFPDVRQLCDFQIDRLVQDSHRILQRFLESRSITPGNYCLEARSLDSMEHTRRTAICVITVISNFIARRRITRWVWSRLRIWTKGRMCF